MNQFETNKRTDRERRRRRRPLSTQIRGKGERNMIPPTWSPSLALEWIADSGTQALRRVMRAGDGGVDTRGGNRACAMSMCICYDDLATSTSLSAPECELRGANALLFSLLLSPLNHHTCWNRSHGAGVIGKYTSQRTYPVHQPNWCSGCTSHILVVDLEPRAMRVENWTWINRTFLNTTSYYSEIKPHSTLSSPIIESMLFLFLQT